MEERRKEILNFFKDLNFDEEKHQYFVKGERIKLSVSGAIKNFVKPFDTKFISGRVATKRGISQEEVLKEWKDKKDKKCERGTETHLFAELYTADRHLKPSNGFEEAVVKFWNDVPSTIVPAAVELRMYHKDFMFAGTADIVMYNTDTDNYIVCDYKTNADLFKNYKSKKMLIPFGDLLDCPYNKYQLQLSFYQMLFEQLGLKVSSRKLIWLRPTGEYELFDSRDYTKTLTDYLKHNEL